MEAAPRTSRCVAVWHVDVCETDRLQWNEQSIHMSLSLSQKHIHIHTLSRFTHHLTDTTVITSNCVRNHPKTIHFEQLYKKQCRFKKISSNGNTNNGEQTWQHCYTKIMQIFESCRVGKQRVPQSQQIGQLKLHTIHLKLVCFLIKCYLLLVIITMLSIEMNRIEAIILYFPLWT